MSTQLSFLPKIDRKETQRRVEEALETARIYKQIGFVRREISNTPSYEARFHGRTNKTSAPVEDCVVWNVANEERLRVLTERVERAVSRLNRREREIITRRYLEDETATDYLTWPEIGMSEMQYYRVKGEAFYKLAFMLGMEVYKEEVAAAG